MISNSELVKKYFRYNKKFPHIWCPGCGIGTILGSMLRAIDDLELDKDDIAFVSGIGCTGRAPVYVDFNTLHTTHGRALPFATGLKLARPELKVIVATGDGDSTAIGGNHLIHACRRNIDITTIIFNNYIYGMTGGQYSPTTPHGDRAYTCKLGNIERPFNISALVEAAGATFVGVRPATTPCSSRTSSSGRSSTRAFRWSRSLLTVPPPTAASTTREGPSRC